MTFILLVSQQLTRTGSAPPAQRRLRFAGSLPGYKRNTGRKGELMILSAY